ncbi:serine/threonine-protein kinase [Aphanothece sacrum]|uniref:serine/threonine-protein kinase n=1 Tax=Aphanothece sacrum TaxID=1122 RepID=UPI000F60A498|nr:serine/threonine-protein kinase [Aphanothece sacrum]GBF86961.1 serine/threonine protein kinase [Aphanothece sacrum FPU3]
MKTTSSHRSNYRLLGQIGQGQFGRVYCAIHRKTGNLVALKDLNDKRFPTNKFLREFAYLIRLRHPNIVSCHAIEYHPQGRYLVMDYCEGGTLRDLMESEANLSLGLRLKLITDILLGLEHAHENRIIHCDIKPENILLSLTNNSWIARITDFGISRFSEEQNISSQGQGYTGSPAYMSPERYYGKYSYPCDIYSVGIIFYELMVGERPFSGLPGDLMTAHLNQRITIPDSVPTPLHSIITKALEKLPQRRFTSAKEMLTSLQLAIDKLGDQISTSWLLSPPSFPEISSDITLVKQESLNAAITHLGVDSQYLYSSTSDRLSCQTYFDSTLRGDPIQQWQISLSEPIIEMNLRNSCCFVLTRSLTSSVPQYTFYQFSPIINLSNLTNYRISPTLFAHDCISAIDLHSHWLALVCSSQYQDISTRFQLFKLPDFFPIYTSIPCPLPSQIVPLDRRYGLALFPRQSQENQRTFLYLFHRRGRYIKKFSFPLFVSSLIPNYSSGYEFFSIETNQPMSGIIIKFKPLKVTRIPLNINPTFIIAQKWGYGLGNEEGKVIFLDRDGFQIGYLELSKTITAMAGFGETGLLIATFDKEKGELFRFDLANLISRTSQFND